MTENLCRLQCRVKVFMFIWLFALPQARQTFRRSLLIHKPSNKSIHQNPNKSLLQCGQHSTNLSAGMPSRILYRRRLYQQYGHSLWIGYRSARVIGRRSLEFRQAILPSVLLSWIRPFSDLRSVNVYLFPTIGYCFNDPLRGTASAKSGVDYFAYIKDVMHLAFQRENA